MKIGIRTIKTAIGVGLSLWIAKQLGLTFFVSAAILTVLCIETTKKRSLKVSFHRMFACITGLLMGGIFFTLLGYHAWVFTVLILVFLPFLVKLKMQGGFVSSTVIVAHLFVLEKFNLTILWNELQIIFVGIGVALLMNSYMPKLEKTLLVYQQEVEGMFKKILTEYAVYIEKGDQGWSGEEILEVENLLKQAKNLALRNVENQWLRSEDTYYRYFDMREKQWDIIERMLPLVSALDKDVPQRSMFAAYLYELSDNVTYENRTSTSLEKLEDLREEMKELALPTTRDEFETRASLFHLMNEIELYLKTKNKYLTKKDA